MNGVILIFTLAVEVTMRMISTKWAASNGIINVNGR